MNNIHKKKKKNWQHEYTRVRVSWYFPNMMKLLNKKKEIIIRQKTT